MSTISFRDLIARMTDVFDPTAAGSLVASIQFRASGKEPGDYYVHIKNGECMFKEGVSESPSATIHTPSEMWIAINLGEMDGAQAFMQGKFRVGDFGPFVRMRDLFKRR